MATHFEPHTLIIGLKGWRDRVSGTMHLRGDCPDFEELDAARIQDTLWRPGVHYERLCSWCFPVTGEEDAPRPTTPWHS